jgi:hypothetical protein
MAKIIVSYRLAKIQLFPTYPSIVHGLRVFQLIRFLKISARLFCTSLAAAAQPM